MDAKTLSKLTSHISYQRCQELIPGLLEAWKIAEVNTVKRRAGWFSQVLEESVGLSATTEFASGAEYEGRVDLGNTQPGDGVRFKGRGFIQVTGRFNYGTFGQWCHQRGLISDSNYFINHPEAVANDRFAWISVAWYWLAYHNHGYDYLNNAADAGDLVAMTYMVNGAQNGYDTRLYYYRRALALGNELMGEEDFMMDKESKDYLDKKFAAMEKSIKTYVDRRITRLAVSLGAKDSPKKGTK